MTAAPLLECVKVSKVFGSNSGKPQVGNKDIRLRIQRGDFLVIIGRTGVGKTTLLNLMGGLERPSSGSILFQGLALEHMSNKELTLFRRDKVGFVFQSFNLLPAYSIFENIEIALGPSYPTEQERHARVFELLDRVGLRDKADRVPAEISVGQQQKAAIARAMGNEPSFILADEPTGALDPITAKDIIAEFIKLNKEDGVALVVTTCGMFPTDNASSVLYMKDGQLVTKVKAGY